MILFEGNWDYEKMRLLLRLMKANLVERRADSELVISNKNKDPEALLPEKIYKKIKMN